MDVFEGDWDSLEACWSDSITTTVSCALPCDSLDITNTSASTADSTCCSTFTATNNHDGTLYKGFKIFLSPPMNISQLTALNGYVINQFGPFSAEIYPPAGGTVPLGTQDIFNICTQGQGNATNLVMVSWLMPTPDGGCAEVCPKELEYACEDDDDKKCYEFVQDSIDCPTSTYCFQIKNTSNPGFDLYSVNIYDETGGLVLTPSGRINIPNAPLASGQTSDWICVTYSGVNPTDNVCYKLSAHNQPVGTPPNQCCTDTIKTCFTIPTCDPVVCEGCPNGLSQGPEMITNGDFESGNTGFTSTYLYEAYAATNNLTPGEYGVRNSTEYNNAAWYGIDHTTNSPSGQFLIVDGDGAVGNAFWSQTINTVPGQLYSMCLFYDNMVVDGIIAAEGTPPSVNITENTNIIGSFTVPQTPDGWQNVSLTFIATATTTNLEMAFNIVQPVDSYFDIAIDDISVTSCGATVNDCCDDIDEEELCDYYDSNITVINDDCEGCVTVSPLDPCDVITIDLMDGNGFVTLTDTICRTFLGGGTYPFTVKVTRLNDDGEPCFEKDFVNQFDIEGCGGSTCCDITEEEFCDRWDSGINNLSITDCEVCIPLPLDSCDYVDVDWGDGTTWSTMGGGQLPCYSYDNSGVYFVNISYYRLDAMGDTCQIKQIGIEVEIDCPPPPQSSCLSVIDGELDCEAEMYCLRIVNTSANPAITMKSLAFIELTPGLLVSPDPYQLVTPLSPGDTSEVICLSYFGVSQGDTACLEVVAHEGDITIGEDTGVCCKSDEECFIIDCPTTPSGGCITMVEDSINCDANMYCIKVMNTSSSPGYIFRSLGITGESAGMSLSPDPISTPALMPGMTSDWICFTFAGLSGGDTGCYTLIAHQQDIANGEEPEICCTSSEEYCFTLDDDCDPNDCCSNATMDEVADYFADGTNATISQCNLTLPFDTDSCAVLTIDFGDGNVSQSTGGGNITHSYAGNGTYIVNVLLQYFDSNGEVCIEIEDTIEIPIDDCGNVVDPCTTSSLDIFNALSPNRDGLNDVLVIEGGQTCELDIKVFNRWGQMVYSKANYKNDWNGISFSGETLAEGTYFLVVEITDSLGGVVEMTQTYIDIRK